MATVRGGAKLDAALRELAAKVAVPATLRVGFLENARYPDGTPVAMIAAINEYGRPPTQPPRPFFRNMIRDKQGEWPAMIGALLKSNDLDAAKTLDETGAVIAGQLRQSITDLWEPPLAASTIQRKGSAKPLIESGDMLKAVDHEVKVR